MALRHQAESPKQANPGDILVVIHAFEARSPDELSLIKGERVELVEKDDDFGDGWYLGRHLVNGRTGLFPEVYTKLAPPPPTTTTVVRQHRSGSAPNAASNPTFQSPPATAPPLANIGAYSDDARVGMHSTNGPHAAFSQHYQPTPPPLNPGSATTQRTVSVPATAFTSPTVSSAPATQRSISMTMEGTGTLQDNSPVINETLSVIDEHITDMHAPRSNLFSHDMRTMNDSGSDYSGRLGNRLSYINGNETDEEERNAYTVKEVNRWNAQQVAEFLEDIGVERKHCDVFKEQEISGEVLLNLDQATLFMKEFDLGVVGRRLRTWHKIKSFQDEVRSTSRVSTGKRTSSQATASDANTLSTPATSSSIPGMKHLRQSSPLAESYTPDMSKGAVREPSLPTMPESPRLSIGPVSRDSSSLHRGTASAPRSRASQPQLGDVDAPTPSPSSHHKKPSLDRNWTMSSSGSPVPNRSSFLPATTRSRGASTIDLETGSDGTREMDRGYLSGSEIDSRKHRNVLRKRDTVVSTHSHGHSRQSSYKEATSTTGGKRHSRFGSAGSFIASLAPGRAHDEPPIPHLGLDSKDTTLMIGDSPVVTRLEYDSPRNTVVSRKHESQPADSSRSSLSQSLKSPNDGNVPRIEEKTSSLSSTVAASPLRNSTGQDASVKSPTRTVSTTETSKSIELEQTKSKSSTPGLTPLSGKRTKNKKQTSAYTRGLMKRTPREAMADCDYSGWMKKKSPSLIATWKPRLFVLRGRRLSYYYSENDTEEQGLIDISNHKVLPADDLLTGIHATVTGAKSSPTSPANAHTETMNEAEVAAEANKLPTGASNENIFIFKLVPPRAGLSRAVNFTKPTVHYFAVDNIRQGRLWMAALMKATIEMDSTKPMVTTYGQKTISLAKAQQMKQRPPDLQDVNEDESGGAVDGGDEADDDEHATDEAGLKIKGIDMDYEYLGADPHAAASGNGEPESGGGPTSAPLFHRASAQGHHQATGSSGGGRATASYQGPQNSLRLVRSLSGGLSHQSHQEDEGERSNAYGERPSTATSKQSHPGESGGPVGVGVESTS